MEASKPSQREHFWDATRAFLMLLGIPYHTALSYQPDREWIVVSGEGKAGFTYLAEFIHLFRMPAFFVIAGYFAALLLTRRSPGTWLLGRLRRVGVPFLACIITLVPLLNLACELSALPLPEALASWRHNSLTSGGYWVRHLWFIIVLLYCSVAVAALAWLKPELRSAIVPERIDRWVARHFLAFLAGTAMLLGLWEAVAIELFYTAGLATNVPQQILRLDELISYAPYFLIGCLFARSPHARERLSRFSPSVAIAAIIMVSASLAFMHELSPAAGRFLSTLAAVAITQVIIAAAKLIADQPNPVVQEIAASSFVLYLFHMPIIVILVAIGGHVALPVTGKALGVMLLSLALSYAAWRAISRSSVLSFLFNGDSAPAALRQRMT